VRVQGARKPSPEAYARVIAHLGQRGAPPLEERGGNGSGGADQQPRLTARQLLLVDDRQANVDAARVAGMRAVRFDGSAAALEAALRSPELGLLF
jgi:beta-phosphoglucomutase-like phosphatase (HAD superfamily)